MKHHTKEKGDLGVFKAQMSLCEQGFMVLNPLTEHSPFDIVAYKDKNFYRIQVKYRKIKEGSVKIQLRTSWSDTNGRHVSFYDKSEVDIICLYCPNTDKCYYFDVNTPNKSFTLRFKKPKVMSKNIHLAENYECLVSLTSVF